MARDMVPQEMEVGWTCSHVVRREGGRWPTRMLEWTPAGKRSQGRKKMGKYLCGFLRLPKTVQGSEQILHVGSPRFPQEFRGKKETMDFFL